MLRNKANNSSGTQSQKYNYASDRPASEHFRFGSELVLVPKLFPVTSDYVSGNSAITTGQISGSHEPVSNEAAFRKMFRFALVGKKTRISGWGWSSPSTNGSTFSFQGQRVLGIDSLYGTPVQSGESKDVVNDNFRFGDLDTWIPKQQPGKIAKPQIDPDFGQQNAKRFGGQRNGTNYGKRHGQYRHNFARTGSKQLGIHTFSFTQSAVEAGAAL